MYEAKEAVTAPLRAARGAATAAINTAYIERLNATFRARPARSSVASAPRSLRVGAMRLGLCRPARRPGP